MVLSFFFFSEAGCLPRFVKSIKAFGSEPYEDTEHFVNNKLLFIIPLIYSNK